MRKKLLNENTFTLLLVIAEFLIAFLTIHAFLDDSVKLYSILALLCVLFVPYILLQKKKISSFFRFTAVFFAFIPTIQPPALSSLLKQDFFSVIFSADHNLIVLSIVNKELIFVLLILAVIFLKSGHPFKKWHLPVFIFSLLCGAGMFFFNTVWEILMYVSTYLLIILTFDFLEKIFDNCKEKYEKLVLWLFVSTLFLKGLYQMLVILETHPLS